jgi:site-specific DNA-methyltransferase (adenine-specific)
MTYLVAGAFDSQKEAENYEIYLRTRFVRFLVGVLKNTQDVSRNKFQFVPILSMKESWNDEKLFKKFGITKNEQDFIFSMIREMPKVEE